MADDLLRVSVECHAGYRGEERPVRIRFPDRLVDVVEILDQWLAPDHRYFKVRTAEGDTCILRHDSAADAWELTYFERGRRSG